LKSIAKNQCEYRGFFPFPNAARGSLKPATMQRGRGRRFFIVKKSVFHRGLSGKNLIHGEE
jgi:hypothetical protein